MPRRNLIGVNNRDLRTFTLDIETTGRCAKRLEIRDWRLSQSPISNLQSLLVSESGIFTPADVARVRLGARAVLVGESSITSPNMAEQVRTLSSVAASA